MDENSAVNAAASQRFAKVHTCTTHKMIGISIRVGAYVYIYIQ